MTTAIRKARQRARKAEKGEKEIRFYASPKAQEWAKQEFPNLSVHEAAKWVFEAAMLSEHTKYDRIGHNDDVLREAVQELDERVYRRVQAQISAHTCIGDGSRKDFLAFAAVTDAMSETMEGLKRYITPRKHPTIKEDGK